MRSHSDYVPIMGGRTRPNDCIRVETLKDQHLVLNGQSVMIGGHVAGSIALRTYGPRKGEWHWHFYAVGNTGPDNPSEGFTATRQQAMVLFRLSFDTWFKQWSKVGVAGWKGSDSEWGPPRRPR